MTREADQQTFRQITEPYELFQTGLLEYQVIPNDRLGQYQAKLRAHLEELTGTVFGDGSELSEAQILELGRRVWRDFCEIDLFDTEDEIIAWHDGVVMLVTPPDQNCPRLLNDDCRLHGRIVRPAVLPAPYLDSINYHPQTGQIDYSGIVEQSAYALELEAVSIESYGRYESPPDETVVYLPLCYNQMKIKKRVTDS